MPGSHSDCPISLAFGFAEGMLVAAEEPSDVGALVHGSLNRLVENPVAVCVVVFATDWSVDATALGEAGSVKLDEVTPVSVADCPGSDFVIIATTDDIAVNSDVVVCAGSVMSYPISVGWSCVDSVESGALSLWAEFDWQFG